MQRNLSTFYVAVVAGITSLFLAQIYAPIEFKPLTNRLLDYPGNSIPTVLQIYQDIPRIQFLRAKVKFSWSPFKILQIARVSTEEGDVNVKVALKPAKPVAVKPKPTNNEEEVADPIPVTPAPTLTPPPVTVTTIQQDVYTEINGTETLRYGYQLTAADTYVDKANGESCTDGQGTISGTYCAPNGTRYNVANQDTADAAATFNQKVAEKVATLSNEEVAQVASTIQNNNCGSTDTACNTAIVASAALTIDDTKTIEAVVKTQQENQAFQDKIQAFLDPSKNIQALANCGNDPECPTLTAEMYLKKYLGVIDTDIQKLLDTRNKNIKATADLNANISKYLDFSIDTAELAKERCGTNQTCLRDFRRDDLLTGLDKSSEDYKNIIAQGQVYLDNIAKNQLAQNRAQEYLTLSYEELAQKYCPTGTTADRCESLIKEGGVLKAAGLSSDVSQEIVNQKLAIYALGQYESGSLVKATKLDYQTEYEKQFNLCQTSMSQQGLSANGCSQVASSIAQNNVDQQTDSQAAKMDIRSKESVALITACNTLGGTSCSDSISSLDSLGQLTGIEGNDAVYIQSQKLKIEAENIAYQQVTKAYSGQQEKLENFTQAVNNQDTTWTEINEITQNLKKDPLTATVMSWNNFTSDRFSYGNNKMLDAAGGNGMTRTMIAINLSNNTLGIVSADQFGSLMGLENHIDKWGVLTGGLIQGGDAAAATVLAGGAALAAPMGVGLTGFLTTGMGVAATTQMTSTAAYTCDQVGTNGITQANCDSARNMAFISAAGTGLGVLSQSIQLVNNGAALAKAGSLTQLVANTAKAAPYLGKATSYANIAVSGLSTVTFTEMAIETCGQPGVSTLDCSSSIMMAVAAGTGFASSSVGSLINGLDPIINSSESLANAAIAAKNTSSLSKTASGVLQSTHVASSVLFAASACSKLDETANADTLAMCAMGISGLTNTAIDTSRRIAATQESKNATATKSTLSTEPLERMASTKELELLKSAEKLTELQKRVAGLEKMIKENKVSGSLVKQATESLLSARAELEALQISLKPTESVSQTSTSEKIVASLSKLQDGKTEIPVKEIAISGKTEKAYEINVDAIASPEAQTAAKQINELIRGLEADANIVLQREQVEAIVSKETITQLKAADGASLKGKTAVITRILSLSEPRTMILTENATSAKAYIDAQVLSPEGKKFYARKGAKIIVLDAERGFLEVDMASTNFDRGTAKPVSAEQARILLEASQNGGQNVVFVADYANAIWTRIGGNETGNLNAFQKLFGSKEALRAEGVLMKEIAQNKKGQFLFIADEISSSIYSNFANSAAGKALKNVTDGKLLGGVKSGSEAISLYNETVSKSKTHIELVAERMAELKNGQAQSSKFKLTEKGKAVPESLETHANTMAEVIELSLNKTNSRSTSSGKALEAIAERLKNSSTANEALKELDAFISSNSNTKSSLLTDLNFRKSSIQEDWNQLARIPGTEFAQEGSNLVLRKENSTTGERLSSANQLISFYEKGKEMLKAYTGEMVEGTKFNPNNLPDIADIQISPKGSQMTVQEFFKELGSAGHNIKGLDATPLEAIHALNLPDRVIETPIKIKNLFVEKARSTVAELFAKERVVSHSKQASAIVFDRNNPNVSQDILEIVQKAYESGVGYETLVLAQNKKSPNGQTVEEFVQYEIGTRTNEKTGKTEAYIVTEKPLNLENSNKWNDAITKVTAQSPEKVLIAINVERGLDLATGLTKSGQLHWSEFYDATGNAKPTSVGAEQNWRRDRLFGENHDVYLVTEKTGLTRENVWQDFFVENLNNKLAENRFQDALSAIAKSPESALTALDAFAGRELKLNWLERMRFERLKTELSREASSFESLINSSVSREGLQGEALMKELYTRAETSNKKILGMYEEAISILKLTPEQAKNLKTEMGGTENFIKQEEFLSQLDKATETLTKPENNSPDAVLKAYAANNSTAEGANPRYKAVAEQHLSGSQSNPIVSPATAAAPVTQTNTPSTPSLLSRIGSSISSIFIPRTQPTTTSTATTPVTEPVATRTTITVPRIVSIPSLITLPEFKELVLETDYGSTFTIQNGMIKENESDFSPFDPELLPLAIDVTNIRYNGNGLTTNNLTGAGLRISETKPVEEIINSTDFLSLEVDNADGTTFNISKVGDKLIFTETFAANTPAISKEFEVSDLDKLPSQADETFAISYNGLDLPLTAIKNNAPSPITTDATPTLEFAEETRTPLQQMGDWIMGRNMGIINNPQGNAMLNSAIDGAISAGKNIGQTLSNFVTGQKSDGAVTTSAQSRFVAHLSNPNLSPTAKITAVLQDQQIDFVTIKNAYKLAIYRSLNLNTDGFATVDTEIAKAITEQVTQILGLYPTSIRTVAKQMLTHLLPASDLSLEDMIKLEKNRASNRIIFKTNPPTLEAVRTEVIAIEKYLSMISENRASKEQLENFIRDYWEELIVINPSIRNLDQDNLFTEISSLYNQLSNVGSRKDEVTRSNVNTKLRTILDAIKTMEEKMIYTTLIAPIDDRLIKEHYSKLSPAEQASYRTARLRARLPINNIARPIITPTPDEDGFVTIYRAVRDDATINNQKPIAFRAQNELDIIPSNYTDSEIDESRDYMLNPINKVDLERLANDHVSRAGESFNSPLLDPMLSFTLDPNLFKNQDMFGSHIITARVPAKYLIDMNQAYESTTGNNVNTYKKVANKEVLLVGRLDPSWVIESNETTNPQQAKTPELINNLPKTGPGLLDFLDNLIPNTFRKSIGVITGSDPRNTKEFSLRQHTLMVFNLYEKYFSKITLPGNLDHNYLRLIIGLHDIGKPRAIEEGDRTLQYQYNTEIINEFFEKNGLDKRYQKIAAILSGDDIIGQYISKQLDVEQTLKKIIELTEGTGLTPQELLDLMVIFHKIDGGAYTTTAGAPDMLNFLYKFDKTIKYTDAPNNRMNALYNLLIRTTSAQLDGPVKSLEESALDALLGRTSGITQGPDLRELGRSLGAMLANIFNRKSQQTNIEENISLANENVEPKSLETALAEIESINKVLDNKQSLDNSDPISIQLQKGIQLSVSKVDEYLAISKIEKTDPEWKSKTVSQILDDLDIALNPADFSLIIDEVGMIIIQYHNDPKIIIDALGINLANGLFITKIDPDEKDLNNLEKLNRQRLLGGRLMMTFLITNSLSTTTKHEKLHFTYSLLHPERTGEIKSLKDIETKVLSELHSFIGAEGFNNIRYDQLFTNSKITNISDYTNITEEKDSTIIKVLTIVDLLSHLKTIDNFKDTTKLSQLALVANSLDEYISYLIEISPTLSGNTVTNSLASNPFSIVQTNTRTYANLHRGSSDNAQVSYYYLNTLNKTLEAYNINAKTITDVEYILNNISSILDKSPNISPELKSNMIKSLSETTVHVQSIYQLIFAESSERKAKFSGSPEYLGIIEKSELAQKSWENKLLLRIEALQNQIENIQEQQTSAPTTPSTVTTSPTAPIRVSGGMLFPVDNLLQQGKDVGERVTKYIRQNITILMPKYETSGYNYLRNRTSNNLELKLLREIYVDIESYIKNSNNTSRDSSLIQELNQIKKSTEYLNSITLLENFPNQKDLINLIDNAILADLQAATPEKLFFDELKISKNDLLESALLIDNTYFIPTLLSGQEDPRYIFNVTSFENWIEARNLASSKEKLITEELTTSINSIINNNQNVGYRNKSIVAGDYMKVGKGINLSNEQIEAIQGNALLRWNPANNSLKSSQLGFIVYPTVDSYRNNNGDLIRYFTDDDIKRLLTPASYEIYLGGGSSNESLIKALMHDLIAWVNIELLKEDVDFVAIAAEFQYKFISIHPFKDGNGRTSRILMNKILNDNGLNPSIILHPENDYYYSLENWISEIRSGMYTYQEISKNLEAVYSSDNSPNLSTVVNKIKYALFGSNWEISSYTSSRKTLSELPYKNIDANQEIFIAEDDSLSLGTKKLLKGSKITHNISKSGSGNYQIFTPDGFPIQDSYINRKLNIARANLGLKIPTSNTYYSDSYPIYYKKKVTLNNASKSFAKYVDYLQNTLSSQSISHNKLDHTLYDNSLKKFIDRFISLNDKNENEMIRSSASRLNLVSRFDPEAYSEIYNYLDTNITLYRGVQLSSHTSPQDLLKYFTQITTENSAYRTYSDPDGINIQSFIDTLKNVNIMNQFDKSENKTAGIQKKLSAQELEVAKNRKANLEYRVRLKNTINTAGKYIAIQINNHLGITKSRKDHNYLVSPFVSTAENMDTALGYAVANNKYVNTRILFEFYQPTEGYINLGWQTLLTGGVDPKSIKNIYLLNEDGLPIAVATLTVNSISKIPEITINEYDLQSDHNQQVINEAMIGSRFAANKILRNVDKLEFKNSSKHEITESGTSNSDINTILGNDLEPQIYPTIFPSFLSITAITSLGATSGQSILSALSPYIMPLIPSMPILIDNIRLWTTSLPILAPLNSIQTWLDTVLPPNFSFVPFGMTVVTPQISIYTYTNVLSSPRSTNIRNSISQWVISTIANIRQNAYSNIKSALKSTKEWNYLNTYEKQLLGQDIADTLRVDQDTANAVVASLSEYKAEDVLYKSGQEAIAYKITHLGTDYIVKVSSLEDSPNIWNQAEEGNIDLGSMQEAGKYADAQYAKQNILYQLGIPHPPVTKVVHDNSVILVQRFVEIQTTTTPTKEDIGIGGWYIRDAKKNLVYFKSPNGLNVPGIIDFSLINTDDQFDEFASNITKDHKANLAIKLSTVQEDEPWQINPIFLVNPGRTVSIFAKTSPNYPYWIKLINLVYEFRADYPEDAQLIADANAKFTIISDINSKTLLPNLEVNVSGFDPDNIFDPTSLALSNFIGYLTTDAPYPTHGYTNPASLDSLSIADITSQMNILMKYMVNLNNYSRMTKAQILALPDEELSNLYVEVGNQIPPHDSNISYYYQPTTEINTLNTILWDIEYELFRRAEKSRTYITRKPLSESEKWKNLEAHLQLNHIASNRFRYYGLTKSVLSDQFSTSPEFLLHKSLVIKDVEINLFLERTEIADIEVFEQNLRSILTQMEIDEPGHLATLQKSGLNILSAMDSRFKNGNRSNADVTSKNKPLIILEASFLSSKPVLAHEIAHEVMIASTSRETVGANRVLSEMVAIFYGGRYAPSSDAQVNAQTNIQDHNSSWTVNALGRVYGALLDEGVLAKGFRTLPTNGGELWWLVTDLADEYDVDIFANYRGVTTIEEMLESAEQIDEFNYNFGAGLALALSEKYGPSAIEKVATQALRAKNSSEDVLPVLDQKINEYTGDEDHTTVLYSVMLGLNIGSDEAEAIIQRGAEITMRRMYQAVGNDEGTILSSPFIINLYQDQD